MAHENLISPGWTYELGFTPPTRGKAPELVFRTALKNQEIIESRFKDRIPEDAVKAYFGKPVAFFHPDGWEDDQRGFRLSKREIFGFGGCGYIARTDDAVEYRLPLVRRHAYHIALTINVVSELLNALLAQARGKEAVLSNRKQLIEVSAFVRIGESLYGHPVGGDVFSAARAWLRRYAETCSPSKQSWYGGRPLPEPVLAAIQSAWRALARDEARKYAHECGGSVSEDGRFTLICLGDACDVSMYPDGDPHDSRYPFRFSCHNLDGAVQQLTLLSGLAALFQLITNDVL